MEFLIHVARVLLTGALLLYGSVTDVRERRVPNAAWYPFVAAGLALDGAALLLEGAVPVMGYALLLAPAGYVALRVSMDEGGWDRFFDRFFSFGGARFLFYGAVLGLAGGAGFLGSAAGSGVLAAVSTSVLAALGLVVFIDAFGSLTGQGMGGADLKAILVVAVLLPAFPQWTVAPGVFGIPVVAVFMNGLLAGLAYPVALFLWNLVRGNRGYPAAMFVGRPVAVDRLDPRRMKLLQRADEDGELRRTGVMRPLRATEERVDELRRSGADRVWATALLPFVAYVFAGFLVAVTYGDVYSALLRALL